MNYCSIRVNKVMVGVQRANLQSEFDRVSERVELQASAERSYLKLDDELRATICAAAPKTPPMA